MIYVFGDDYSALEFERYFQGESIKNIIERIFDNLEEYDGDFEVKLYEFERDIDPEFMQFVRKKIQDHDSVKHGNFYFEGEVLK